MPLLEAALDHPPYRQRSSYTRYVLLKKLIQICSYIHMSKCSQDKRMLISKFDLTANLDVQWLSGQNQWFIVFSNTITPVVVRGLRDGDSWTRNVFVFFLILGNHVNLGINLGINKPRFVVLEIVW